jgi:hypothetical protein
MVGPSYCEKCREWPARRGAYGLLCDLCEAREWCARHPVPLPSDPKLRAEIEALRAAHLNRERT